MHTYLIAHFKAQMHSFKMKGEFKHLVQLNVKNCVNGDKS